MTDGTPDLHVLNLVVAGMAANMAFYRRLGIAGPQSQHAAAATCS